MQSAQEYKISPTDIEQIQETMFQRSICLAIQIASQMETKPEQENELKLLGNIIENLTKYKEDFC